MLLRLGLFFLVLGLFFLVRLGLPRFLLLLLSAGRVRWQLAIAAERTAHERSVYT